MELSELNPHIRFAQKQLTWHHSMEDDYIPYDCRLLYIINGIGTAHINGEPYPIDHGTLIYLPPKTHLQVDFASTARRVFIDIDFDLIDKYSHIKSSLGTANSKTFDTSKIPKYTLHPTLAHPMVLTMPSLESPLDRLCELFVTRPRLFRETASALLKLSLVDIINESGTGSEYSELCEKVLSYIHENYQNSSLQNTDIADAFNYHPYHLNRIIKHETGMTLHHALTEYRMHIAKNYLITTDIPVEEIARKCGFGSVSYFIKIFKEHFGISPKKYRSTAIL